MPKKKCCCNTSCCDPHNFTNNVATINDLLVDYAYDLDDEGKIKYQDGVPVIIDQCQIFPVHPDDELILFQTPYGGDLGNNKQRVYNNGLHFCKCCYGYSTYRTQRNQTIRQKYKYVGCSWVWYPPKFSFNYDANIPQCGIAASNSPAEVDPRVNCFEYTSGIRGPDPAGELGGACKTCVQVNPSISNAAYWDGAGREVFDKFGNLNPNADPTPATANTGILPPPDGWFSQFTAFLYPGHSVNIGLDCCACRFPDRTISQRVADFSNSCWKNTTIRTSPGNCENIFFLRTNTSPNNPYKKSPLTKDGGIFYSTFEGGRINSVIGSAEIEEFQTFKMGKNVEGYGEAYFVNPDVGENLYKPSKGGYNQNSCTFCSLSPYLREMAYNSYPWAYSIFCAGGGLDTSAKTYNFPRSFIKTGYWSIPPQNQWFIESISDPPYKDPNGNPVDVALEQWASVLGEHTFYSQYVGMVQLEHYWHYTGVNKYDLEAAVKTIPYGLEEDVDVKQRWDYWKGRTTPRVFVLKTSATPLFTFDLVYAERLGIFDKFTDPDETNSDPIFGPQEDQPKMTIQKFLSYFSQFANSYYGTETDARGASVYPTGCTEIGHKYVQVVRDIISAMCEAGIIGVRDHRQNIYNEIKQIIQSGIVNGESGAYYKPWAPGNAIPVTPMDFNKLKAKYYDPYGRMCTEKEIFPEEGVDGLGKLGPIRKVIPPSLLPLDSVVWNEAVWKEDHDGQDPPALPPLVYRANTFNPDDIFTEEQPFGRSCVNGNPEIDPNQLPRKKIQNLQFSKYYSGGSYDSNAPDYVNSQLFFRAIPGRWSFSKWAQLAQGQECAQTDMPCSPYNLYGVGAANTGNPENLWHSEAIRTNLFKTTDPRYVGGYQALCNGIDSLGANPEGTVGNPCIGDPVLSRTGSVYCGYEGIAWDASGSPSTVRCTPVCVEPNDSCCDRTLYPCGCECGGIKDCAQANLEVNGNVVWQETKTCAELFGKSCCECLGFDPNVNVTVKDWVDALVENGGCKTCSEECNFACPETTGTPLFASLNGDGKNKSTKQNIIPVNAADDRDFIFKTNYMESGAGGGPTIVSGKNPNTSGSGNQTDDGTNTGVCLPCPQDDGCVTLGVNQCDSNCGYNGFSYDNLAFVLNSSNYAWGDTFTVPSDEFPDPITCSICKCTGYNTCYVRFGGKVQKYLPNENTGFYEPTENPDGSLYDVSWINMETPYHYLNPAKTGSAGRTALQIILCNSGCDNDITEYEACICNNNPGLNTIMCPGAVSKAYLQRRKLNGQCDNSALWCGYYRSGRVILKPITQLDLMDTGYEY